MGTLCLDLATKTGWAHSNGGSGVWNLEAATRPRVWGELRRRLEEVERPGLLVIEKPHFRGGDATRVLVGLATVAELFASDCSIRFAEVHSSTLKKHATGRGDATKEQVMAAARLRGLEPIDDNHADAVWLLDYAICNL